MASILILEDEQDFARLLDASLQDNGHTPVICLDVPSAMHAMTQTPIDLILADLFIRQVNDAQPDSGLSLLKHVRESQRDTGFYTPIIVMSSKVRYPGTETALDTAVALGADGALEKPFAPDELLALIDKVLAREHQSVLDRIRGFFGNTPG